MATTHLQRSAQAYAADDDPICQQLRPRAEVAAIRKIMGQVAKGMSARTCPAARAAQPPPTSHQPPLRPHRPRYNREETCPTPHRLRLAKVRIAVVFISALAVLCVLVYLLSGGTWLKPKAYLTTHIPDSTGLDPDADVLLNGVKIGKVVSVQLSRSRDPNRVVEVRLEDQQIVPALHCRATPLLPWTAPTCWGTSISTSTWGKPRNRPGEW